MPYLLYLQLRCKAFLGSAICLLVIFLSLYLHVTVRDTLFSGDLESIPWVTCANQGKPSELGPLRSRAGRGTSRDKGQISGRSDLIQWLFAYYIITPLQPCRDSSRWKVFFIPITAFIVRKLCNMAAQLKVSSQVQGVGGGVE